MTVRAQDQLDRLLLTLPQLAEDTELPLAELAERVGTDERTLLKDLEALDAQDRDVAGFVESVELYLGPTGVGVRTSFFKRPMRLSRSELAALDLGLGMLLMERSLEERASLLSARAKLRGLSVVSGSDAARGSDTLSPDAAPQAFAVESVSANLLVHFGTLWNARDEKRAVTITYRRANSDTREPRIVHPWAVVRAHQHVYVIGWCTSVTAVRVFRLDRIQSVELDGATFEVPSDFDVQQVVREGRVFSGERPDDVLVVRYSPVVARWIAERERVPLSEDGSVTVSWPLADDEWALRHVLQYGAEAAVISPPRIREALLERLQSLLALDKNS